MGKYDGGSIVENPQSDAVDGTVSTMASGPRNFKFRDLPYIVASFGTLRVGDPGAIISSLVNKCFWRQEQNSRECLRCAYDASCVVLIYWLLVSIIAGRTGVTIVMGVRSLINRLTDI